MGQYRVISIISLKDMRMSKIVSRVWGVFLSVIFQGARFVITIMKIRVRGSMVAIWNGDKILLVWKSYRKVWSLPGGLLKTGETWEQAAVRESIEEVGIRVPEEDLKFLKEVPGEFGSRDRLHLFEVTLNGPVDLKLDRREIIFADFVSPEEALKRNLYEHVERYLKARRAGTILGAP